MTPFVRGALPSSAVKAEYQKALVSLVDEMRDSILRHLRARYRAREVEIIGMDASPARELEELLRRLFRGWDRKFEEFAALRSLAFARRVKKSATSQLYNSLREAGLTVAFKNSRRVNNMIQAIVAENVGLIRSIPQRLKNDVREVVMRSVQSGRDMGFVMEEVEDRCKVSRNRAVTIARDQTNKATEAISRARCEEIGITEGIWMHRSGSKVPRSTHKAMNGKRFKLADGIYDSAVGFEVKPGELINCHCTFRPVLPDLAAPGEKA
ncbi:MAG: minor capsid protein [Desulfovibrio sp.]|jgi:SPP1 gp7 family putative phage head morphogenesis protein|nr:minor capsid protein [Desulfovibrio sp.]